jgi:HSP20 family protein
MRNWMDRMLSDSFFNAPSVWERDGEQSLALDVAEEGETFIVKASVPGMKPEDLDITITNNVLTIKGETKEDQEIKQENYHLRERRFGSFVRSVTLPTPVDADKVGATYENGVLTLNIPKSEAVKPKRIAVQNVIEGQHSNGGNR